MKNERLEWNWITKHPISSLFFSSRSAFFASIQTFESKVLCAGALIVSDERLLENSSRIISCWLEMLKGFKRRSEINNRQTNLNPIKSLDIFSTSWAGRYLSSHICFLMPSFNLLLKNELGKKPLSLHPSLEIYSRLGFLTPSISLSGDAVGGGRKTREEGLEIEHRVYDWLVVKIEKSSHCFGASWLSRVMWFILHGKRPNFFPSPIHWWTIKSSSC